MCIAAFRHFLLADQLTVIEETNREYRQFGDENLISCRLGDIMIGVTNRNGFCAGCCHIRCINAGRRDTAIGTVTEMCGNDQTVIREVTADSKSLVDILGVERDTG